MQAAFKVNVFKVNGHFVLPEGRLLGSTSLRSTAISYRLKPARAGAAVAPPLHPGYPANTTARRRRVPSSVHISSRTARDSEYSPHPEAHPFGAAQALFKNAPGVFVRVRAPLFLTLAFGGGFFVLGNGLSIELRSIIRRRRLALLLPSRLSISLEQLPTFKKPQYCCVFISAKYSGCFFAQVQRCFLYIIYRPRPWTIDTKKNPLTP